MQITRTKAFVLRRINYMDADKIVHFLTPEGKLNAIAKGVRREKSRLSSGVEPFRLCDIVLRKSGGDLYLVTSAKVLEIYDYILEDYDRLEFAYEAMKLISKASELISEPEWFELLKDVFESINNQKIDLEIIKGWFYAQYSKLLGYVLNLNVDIDGNKYSFDKRYFYDTDNKGLKENIHGDITGEHIKIMRLMIDFDPMKIIQVGGIKDYLKACNEILIKHCAVY